jgi:hypothetical protein
MLHHLADLLYLERVDFIEELERVEKSIDFKEIITIKIFLDETGKLNSNERPFGSL